MYRLPVSGCHAVTGGTWTTLTVGLPYNKHALPLQAPKHCKDPGTPPALAHQQRLPCDHPVRGSDPV